MVFKIILVFKVCFFMQKYCFTLYSLLFCLASTTSLLKTIYPQPLWASFGWRRRVASVGGAMLTLHTGWKDMELVWRVHCCTKSLFFEIETSNFGSSYIFLSPLKWQGRILPNLTFWTQNWHISGKIQVPLFQNVSWVRDFKFWLQPCFFEPVKMAGSDFT